jgi:hypothetical protein
MGGQPKTEASSLSSPDVMALWEEPAEAIPQNQRDQSRRNPLPYSAGCQLDLFHPQGT